MRIYLHALHQVMLYTNLMFVLFNVLHIYKSQGGGLTANQLE